MIRDPSDGTVRETQHRPETLQTKDLLPEKPALSTGASGLPIDKLKADEFGRLEKSREWLRNRQNLFNEPVASENPTS